jgi:bifunctional DNA-binding transcriptional regulator/antitoxin component of YhaV-PrlF toxin-antitoxin module
MEVAVTKVSSKGQIVITSNMRKNITAGDEFLIIKEDNKFIMKKINELAKDLKKELVFAQRIEKAWNLYEKGKFKSASAKKFLEELEKC